MSDQAPPPARTVEQSSRHDAIVLATKRARRRMREAQKRLRQLGLSR